MRNKILSGASVAALMGFIMTAQAAYAVPPGCTLPEDLHSDPFYNPFSKDSAHHRPIGANATYAGPNDPSTKSWMSNTGHGININVGAPWGVSVAETGPADGFKTINPVKLKCDSVSGFPKSIRFPRNGFTTSVKLNSNGCTDGVVVIYDGVSQVPHQIRQYNWNGGNPLGGQYKTWDIKGLGHGKKPGDRVGTSASGVAALFGVLRGPEINDPNRKVQHAMQMALPRTGQHCAMLLSRKVVLPAVSGDGSMNSGNNNTGNIPYGALMALPPVSKGGPDINKLGLSVRGKNLVEAVRDYGIYVVDGADCNAMRADQFVTGTAELKAALSKIYPYMRMVTNNDNVLSTPTAGGGAPLAPNCAYNGSGSGSSGGSSGGSSSGGSSSGGSSSSGSSGGSSGGGGMGQCGSATGGTFSTMPDLNKCVGGWDYLRNLKTTATGWTWQCVNSTGDNPVSCSAKKTR